MENVTIAVRSGIAYVVDKSNPNIRVEIIDYDIEGIHDDDITDRDEQGNKCIISIE